MSLPRARAALGALFLAAGLAACAAAAPTTRIERGDAVTTGNDTYDTFFREVTEVKAEADKAAAELSDAARPLRDAVGAQSRTPPVDAVRAEAKKLQISGTLLHLDLLPEAKVVVSDKTDEPTEKLLGAAEQAAKGSLAIARRTSELLVRIADLERRHADLLSTERTAFPDEARRADVSRELTAAAAVLASAREAGEKHGGAASKLALDLAMALETGAGSSAAAAKKPPAKPAWSGKGGPAKPRGNDFDP